MAKNYESESKNSRNYTDTTSKNSYGNEMNHTDNARSKNETDSRDKAKNKMKNKKKYPSTRSNEKKDAISLQSRTQYGLQ